jgi:malonyl-CoA/methylmalonyl-CoA synthetase
MNITDLLDRTVASARERVALEWRGTSYTFGEIDARSNRMAQLLLARGFQKGDRLCVQLANSVSFVDLFLACMKLGVIFVPVNVLYRERERDHILRDAEPRLFLTADDVPDASTQSSDRPEASVAADDAAAIIYTSGTTGAAKGAVLSHANFVANAANLTRAWEITAGDRFLLALPLFHIHALGNGLHCWLMSGCRMRLLERFDHRTAGDEFLDFEPTLFFGVPTMYIRLLDLDRDVAAKIGASMRLFVSGSAPLPPHVFNAFEERFGHAILERYGMTETFMTLSNPYRGERRPGTVGSPLPGVSARIDEGELLVRGANVFGGYWRSSVATAQAFTPDGWFRTGDLAEQSSDGYYTLRGRKSDVIISGGFNIYPREIEELLLEQEGVRDAAVIGAADPLRGEVPVAFIVGDADPDRLEKVCRDQLASFKVPRRFVRVEELPKTALGKVQKHLLATRS